MTDELNADSIGFLLRTVHQRDSKSFDFLKFETISATTFQPPNRIVIAGTHGREQGSHGHTTPATLTGSYTLIVTAENHIVRVRMAATTLPGVKVDTGSVQKFEEALSRAFTTDAMQGIADGGVTSVSVESKSMQIGAETPLR